MATTPTQTQNFQSRSAKPDSTRPYRLMLVAAEASGDMLGAGLIRELRAQSDGTALEFFGVGGPRMKDEGVESPFDISELSILGMIEGLKAYGRVKARVRECVAQAVAQKPDAVILIDSWGFTLRVAQGIRAVMPEVALIKYVGPQVWATRPGRAKTLAASVDLLLALHPMDAPYFEREGLETVVVGNPALNVDFSKAEPDAFLARVGLNEDQKILLVLPGSRPSEIKRLAPVFLATMQRILRERSEVKLFMPVAETVQDLVHTSFSDLKSSLYFIDNEEDKLSAMKAAHLALACSGTVTTELALVGCPMVIAYKVEPLTYWIFKNISPLEHVTLFNIMAQKSVAPEYIQHECTEDALIKALTTRLDNEDLRQTQIAEQYKALDLMGRGQPAPAKLAAAAVLRHLSL